MTSNNSSPLPAWLKPFPPIVLLGVFASIGYGIQQPVTAFPPASSAENVLSPQVPSAAPNSLFAPPSQESDSTDPSQPGLDLNASTNLTAPLKLSTDGAAGAALQKFRNSPLNKAFGEALADQKQGKTTEAIAGYRSVLHQMPDALPAHLNLAMAYLQAGQPGKAIPHLQAVVKVDPKNVRIQFELAKVLLHEKRLDEAKLPLRRVVKLMPNNPQPRVLLAQLYYTQKNYQEAFDQWTALDKIDQGQGQPAFAAGSIAAQNLKEPQKALPWLRKSHRLQPNDLKTTVLLGQVLAATENYQEAEPLLRAVAAKVPGDAGLVRMLADVQWQNGNRDAAIHSLQKVLSLKPQDEEAKVALAEALRARAETQEKAGKIAEASNTWQQIRDIFPKNPLPLIRRARLLRQVGRDDDARQLYQKVLQKTPQDPNALLGVAAIDAEKENFDTAYQYFWKAIQVEPQFEPAYAGFVTSAMKAGREKDAYLLMQDWVNEHPDLNVAKHALKALAPAASKPPVLVPLDKTPAPDINTDRPLTLTPVPKLEKPAKTAPSSPDKPQLTPTGKATAESRISPVKSVPQLPAVEPAPEATKPVH